MTASRWHAPAAGAAARCTLLVADAMRSTHERPCAGSSSPSSSSLLSAFAAEHASRSTLTFFHVATWQAPLVVRRARRVRVRRRRRACSPARCAQRASSASSRRLRREQRRAARAGRTGAARRRRRAAPGARRAPSAAAAPASPMDFELWWLLPIPAVFFALGWIAARIDIKHLLRESRALPLSYFRGLNFLLNEQPDKAIESFIEVVKVDPQTIDLHFALGQPVPPPGRDRARDPHAPEPARPPRPAGREARRRRPSSSRRTSIARACSTAPRSSSPSSTARRSSTPSLGAPDLDLRAGEGLGEGDRRHAAHGGDRQAAVPQGDRALPLRARAGRAAAARTIAAARSRHRRARSPTYRGCTRATLLAGDLAGAAGRRRGGDRRVAADRDRRTRRSCRSSPTASPTRTASSATGRRACACCAASRRSIRRSTC